MPCLSKLISACACIVLAADSHAFSFSGLHQGALRLKPSPNAAEFCPSPLVSARKIPGALRCEPITAERTEVEADVEAPSFAAEELEVPKSPCVNEIQKQALTITKGSTIQYLQWHNHQTEMEDLESRVRRPDDFGDELGENSDDEPTWKEEVVRLRKRERLAQMWKAFQDSAPLKKIGSAFTRS
mmetsp:Transcript_40593/g.81859  ORF Transcript_40593/g.81859 Transcript_40593/m.81859 type:complete len:185 (-) Transcript_40593:238-792(-)